MSKKEQRRLVVLVQQEEEEEEEVPLPPKVSAVYLQHLAFNGKKKGKIEKKCVINSISAMLYTTSSRII